MWWWSREKSLYRYRAFVGKTSMWYLIKFLKIHKPVDSVIKLPTSSVHFLPPLLFSFGSSHLCNGANLKEADKTLISIQFKKKNWYLMISVTTTKCAFQRKSNSKILSKLKAYHLLLAFMTKTRHWWHTTEIWLFNK